MADDQMDDLLRTLTTSTRISLEDDDVALIHPRYALYKCRPPLNQEERRRKWLLDQKEKRLDSFILRRGIEALLFDDEEMQEDVWKNKYKYKYKKRWERLECPYKDWLMLSYWLVEIPENFSSDWYYMMCPKGKRAIVVAVKGSTIAYSRKGAFMMKFHSELPGGNPSSRSNSSFTVLDCIFSYETQTLYVLNVLVWGIPLTLSSSELRFFWLTNKFAEHPELKEKSPFNRFKFELPRHGLVEDLPKAMSVHPTFENNSPEVDGILFYHKEALYTSGKSLLCIWLKPFMVQDILSIHVHENYQKEIPPGGFTEPVFTQPVSHQVGSALLLNSILDMHDQLNIEDETFKEEISRRIGELRKEPDGAFLCPITHQLIRDPVIADGMFYKQLNLLLSVFHVVTCFYMWIFM